MGEVVLTTSRSSCESLLHFTVPRARNSREMKNVSRSVGTCTYTLSFLLLVVLCGMMGIVACQDGRLLPPRPAAHCRLNGCLWDNPVLNAPRLGHLRMELKLRGGGHVPRADASTQVSDDTPQARRPVKVEERFFMQARDGCGLCRILRAQPGQHGQ